MTTKPEVIKPVIKSNSKPQLTWSIYVRGFPVEWIENDIRKLFGKVGPIDSMMLWKFYEYDEEQAYAFVNFKNPSDA